MPPQQPAQTDNSGAAALSLREHAQARDPAPDGLRGLAVLLVYVFHYGGGLRSHNPAVYAFGQFTQAGWIGVELFFALSGFLITGLLWENLGQPNALTNFFGRRALRILPLYWGALAVAAVYGLLRSGSGADLRPLLIYVPFLQTLPPFVPRVLAYTPPLPLNHLWTVSVEEQFYLLWPFLILAARTHRRALHLCFWSFGISCVLRTTLFWPGLLPAGLAAHWSPFLLVRGGGLALGGALALGLRSPTNNSANPNPRWPLPLLLGSLLAFALLAWRLGSAAIHEGASFILLLPAAELASVAAVALARVPGLWRRFLSLAALRWMGRISYGFYVLHLLLQPLFDAIGRAATHTDTGQGYQLVRFLVALPITAAAAWLSYVAYERPFLRLKRLFPRQPDPAA